MSALFQKPLCILLSQYAEERFIMKRDLEIFKTIQSIVDAKKSIKSFFVISFSWRYSTQKHQFHSFFFRRTTDDNKGLTIPLSNIFSISSRRVHLSVGETQQSLKLIDAWLPVSILWFTFVWAAFKRLAILGEIPGIFWRISKFYIYVQCCIKRH